MSAGRAVPLAIVVVNYGSSHLLADNLVRTASSVRPDLVVVVDNLSSSRERESVRQLAAQRGWELLAPPQNLGFGGGVNLGMARALQLGVCDVLVLNPDAWIEAEAVWMLQDAVTRSRTTVCAPRIVDGTGATWFAGADLVLTDGATRARHRRSERPGEAWWEWLTGACLLIPSEAWRISGGFDEDYFLYWEDVDFSRRVVRGGGRLRVIEESIAVHDEGGTQRRAGPGRRKSNGYYYYNILNRVLFAVKNLEEEDVRRWTDGLAAAAWEVLLRGGRRQFLLPWGPLRAAWRGVRDARRIARRRLRPRVAGPGRSGQ